VLTRRLSRATQPEYRKDLVTELFKVAVLKLMKSKPGANA
jgi:hypothetical protein